MSVENHGALTVGARSDGLVSITSEPADPNAPAVVLVMPHSTARWLARELLRVSPDSAQQTSEEPKR